MVEVPPSTKVVAVGMITVEVAVLVVVVVPDVVAISKAKEVGHWNEVVVPIDEVVPVLVPPN